MLLDENDVAAGLLLAVNLKGEGYHNPENVGWADGQPICLGATAMACLGAEANYFPSGPRGLGVTFSHEAAGIFRIAVSEADAGQTWGDAVTHALNES